MMRSKLLTVLLLTLLSSGIVVLLYKTAPATSIGKGGFSRFFFKTDLKPLSAQLLPSLSYYIAGFSGQNLYLGNRGNPVSILIGDTLLRKIWPMNISGLEQNGKKTGILYVNKNNFYLADRVHSRFYTGTLDQFNVRDSQTVKATADLIFPVTPKSCLLRTIVSPSMHYNLGKQEETNVYIDSSFLQKSPNSIFSEDGMLEANTDRSLFVYSFFYKNQLIILDSNLRQIGLYRTIDTNFTSKVAVTSVKDGKAQTISGAPAIINTRICLDASLLYVLSKSTADNEIKLSTDDHSSIDVYSMKTGNYIGTIAVPYYRGRPIHEFAVQGSSLYVVADKYLVRYRLPAIYSR